MDVPKREQKEGGFIAAIMAVFRSMRDAITVDGVAADYERFQERLQSTLEDEIAAIYFLMMLQLTEWVEANAPEYVTEPLPRGFSLPSAEYAMDRAAELAANITEQLRSDINRIQRQFANLDTIAEQLQTHLDATLSEARAKRIAITEITRATSHAESETTKRIEQRSPVRLQWIWWTQDDERVCPVCGPLHMKGEVAWAYRFPEGPPAHPNCRCYKEQSIVPAGVRVDTSDVNRSGRRPSEFAGAGR